MSRMSLSRSGRGELFRYRVCVWSKPAICLVPFDWSKAMMATSCVCEGCAYCAPYLGQNRMRCGMDLNSKHKSICEGCWNEGVMWRAAGSGKARTALSPNIATPSSASASTSWSGADFHATVQDSASQYESLKARVFCKPEDNDEDMAAECYCAHCGRPGMTSGTAHGFDGLDIYCLACNNEYLASPLSEKYGLNDWSQIIADQQKKRLRALQAWQHFVLHVVG